MTHFGQQPGLDGLRKMEMDMAQGGFEPVKRLERPGRLVGFIHGPGDAANAAADIAQGHLVTRYQSTGPSTVGTIWI